MSSRAIMQKFAAFDVDKDYSLKGNEVKKLLSAEKVSLKVIDENDDGIITIPEWLKYKDGALSANSFATAKKYFPKFKERLASMGIKDGYDQLTLLIEMIKNAPMKKETNVSALMENGMQRYLKWSESLSSVDFTRSEGIGEIYEIDHSDSEWRKFASKFAPGAIVVLNSCSTGKGGFKRRNMLTSFYKWLGSVKGIKIFAPHKSTASNLVMKKRGIRPDYFKGKTAVASRKRR